MAILGATLGEPIGHVLFEDTGNEELGKLAGAVGGAAVGCLAAQPTPVQPVIYYAPPQVQPRPRFDYAPACRQFKVQEFVIGRRIIRYETWCE